MQFEGPAMSLEEARSLLNMIEDSTMFHLFNRSQYKRNKIIYEHGTTISGRLDCSYFEHILRGLQGFMQKPADSRFTGRCLSSRTFLLQSLNAS